MPVYGGPSLDDVEALGGCRLAESTAPAFQGCPFPVRAPRLVPASLLRPDRTFTPHVADANQESSGLTPHNKSLAGGENDVRCHDGVDRRVSQDVLELEDVPDAGNVVGETLALRCSHLAPVEPDLGGRFRQCRVVKTEQDIVGRVDRGRDVDQL